MLKTSIRVVDVNTILCSVCDCKDRDHMRRTDIDGNAKNYIM